MAAVLRPKSMPSLSPVEFVVLREVCLGKTNKQIATALGVTWLTVRGYVSRLLIKFEVSNRSQLFTKVIICQTHTRRRFII